ncbi:hypothetical protein L798_14884 [Zootermopsis nevadensis]|uniref:Uncharacterized protein n=1 Tax=Zootermopsis nevadensis TaxID=136037 RepID=A0A067QYI7_ZOONE|nr:hypothetical protein L798_14884 [Zootermopsis nevadensis]
MEDDKSKDKEKRDTSAPDHSEDTTREELQEEHEQSRSQSEAIPGPSTPPRTTERSPAHDESENQPQTVLEVSTEPTDITTGLFSQDEFSSLFKVMLVPSTSPENVRSSLQSLRKYSPQLEAILGPLTPPENTTEASPSQEQSTSQFEAIPEISTEPDSLGASSTSQEESGSQPKVIPGTSRKPHSIGTPSASRDESRSQTPAFHTPLTPPYDISARSDFEGVPLFISEEAVRPLITPLVLDDVSRSLIEVPGRPKTAPSVFEYLSSLSEIIPALLEESLTSQEGPREEPETTAGPSTAPDNKTSPSQEQSTSQFEAVPEISTEPDSLGASSTSQEESGSQPKVIPGTSRNPYSVGTPSASRDESRSQTPAFHTPLTLPFNIPAHSDFEGVPLFVSEATARPLSTPLSFDDFSLSQVEVTGRPVTAPSVFEYLSSSPTEIIPPHLEESSASQEGPREEPEPIAGPSTAPDNTQATTAASEEQFSRQPQDIPGSSRDSENAGPSWATPATIPFLPLITIYHELFGVNQNISVAIPQVLNSFHKATLAVPELAKKRDWVSQQLELCALQQTYTEGKLKDFFLELHYLIAKIEVTRENLLKPFKQMLNILQALAPVCFYARVRALEVMSRDELPTGAVYHPRMVMDQLNETCLLMEMLLKRLRSAIKKLEDK